MSDLESLNLTRNKNKIADLNILKGSLGPDVIDIRQLYNQTGLFTYDPSYGATSSCESSITFIDGDEGILLHRGYPIEQLANNSTFLEVAYLLLNGELPSKEDYKNFSNNIINHTMVNEQFLNFYQGFRRDAHPMAILCAATGAMSAFYNDSADINDPQQRIIASNRLIAKIPTLAAMAYKYSIGQPFIYPDNNLSYPENFLKMCFSVPTQKYKSQKILSDAIEKIFILHADHEQNASTSTVRLAGSSGANPFACISAGIASLWGPAHGGANEAVLNMLSEIQNSDNIAKFLKKARDKDDPFRLFGFGHRVYKNYDPRAKVMQKTCYEVLDLLGIKNNPLLSLAIKLEKIALEDEYFIERKLYPNVDFYSGIILQAIGFPTSMFTVLFAVARTVGWVAQWKEMIEDPNQRISRPRQLYTGPKKRNYLKIEKRN